MHAKHDPDHWRAKAAEVRDLAAQKGDEETRSRLFWIAECYDELAERVSAAVGVRCAND